MQVIVIKLIILYILKLVQTKMAWREGASARYAVERYEISFF